MGKYNNAVFLLAALITSGCASTEGLLVANKPASKPDAVAYVELDPAQGYDENLSNAPASGHTKLASLARSTIEIVNFATQPIEFQVRPLDGVWTPHTVLSGANKLIKCMHCTSDQFDISITTDGHEPVVRRVDQRDRVKLFWNPDKGVWDIGILGKKK
jgi:hypothetical protein